MSATVSDQALVEFLASVGIFSTFSRGEIEDIAAKSESRFFDFGATVYNAGDPSEGLFAIRSGAVRIFTEEQGKEISMGVRRQGEVFAEMAALREVPHESSVRASSKTELLFVPRTALAPILARNQAARSYVASYVALSSVRGCVQRLFNLRGKIDKTEIEELIRSTGLKRVAAGKTILEQKATDDRRLYAIRQGRVRLTHVDSGAESPIGVLGPGDVIGERACLLRQEQPATATAETDVVLLVIPEKSVQVILERNPKLR